MKCQDVSDVITRNNRDCLFVYSVLREYEQGEMFS